MYGVTDQEELSWTQITGSTSGCSEKQRAKYSMKACKKLSSNL